MPRSELTLAELVLPELPGKRTDRLTTLPAEVLHNIFTNVTLGELLCIRQTCRSLGVHAATVMIRDYLSNPWCMYTARGIGKLIPYMARHVNLLQRLRPHHVTLSICHPRLYHLERLDALDFIVAREQATTGTLPRSADLANRISIVTEGGPMRESSISPRTRQKQLDSAWLDYLNLSKEQHRFKASGYDVGMLAELVRCFQVSGVLLSIRFSNTIPSDIECLDKRRFAHLSRAPMPSLSDHHPASIDMTHIFRTCISTMINKGIQMEQIDMRGSDAIELEAFDFVMTVTRPEHLRASVETVKGLDLKILTLDPRADVPPQQDVTSADNFINFLNAAQNLRRLRLRFPRYDTEHVGYTAESQQSLLTDRALQQPIPDLETFELHGAATVEANICGFLEKQRKLRRVKLKTFVLADGDISRVLETLSNLPALRILKLRSLYQRRDKAWLQVEFPKFNDRAEGFTTDLVLQGPRLGDELNMARQHHRCMPV